VHAKRKAQKRSAGDLEGERGDDGGAHRGGDWVVFGCGHQRLGRLIPREAVPASCIEKDGTCMRLMFHLRTEKVFSEIPWTFNCIRPIGMARVHQKHASIALTDAMLLP